MPPTVRAKLLLGWMQQHEALRALNYCYFDEHLSDRKAVALWRQYRDRVRALAPRNIAALPLLPLTEAEQQAVAGHLQRLNAGPNGRFLPEVIKVNAGDLVARQYEMVIQRTENYVPEMANEDTRINHCLGIGHEFNGQLIPRQVSPTRFAVDLPHPEFLAVPTPNGCAFQEKDRYIMAVRTPGERLLLWGGYHRTHAVLCHTAGDAPGVAPLVTVMTGIPEVEQFFARRSSVRDVVLCERPALLRDFFDEELFIIVNLRKKRAEGRIEQLRPGEFRAGVFWVNDDNP